MASETTLGPGEIMDILLREIEAADLQSSTSRKSAQSEAATESRAFMGLEKAMSGEMLEIQSSDTGNRASPRAQLLRKTTSARSFSEIISS
jgi:hypothetical protein